MLTVRRIFKGWLLVSITVLFLAVPVGAQVGPAGIVDDRGGILTQQQVTVLERGLTGLGHSYRVVLERHSPKAFASTDELLAHYQPAKAAILMVTFVADQETYFAVWPDGPVYAEFKTKTGVPFGTYADDFLDAYGAEASRGDWVAATLAAVRVIEETLRAASPAQAPVRYGAVLGWGASLLGLVILGALLYRRETHRRRAISQREAAQSKLLAFDRRELGRLQSRMAVALAYQGEQSRRVAQALDAALQAAVDLDAEAHALLAAAELVWAQRRFPQATQAFSVAAAKFEAASDQLQQATATWSPFQRMLESWEPKLQRAQTSLAETSRQLADEQSRTGWSLHRIVRVAAQVPGIVQQAIAARDLNPLEAMDRLASALSQLETVQSDLKGLVEVTTGLDRLALTQAESAELVQRARLSEALIFSEDSPEEALAQVDQIAGRTRQHLLPAGEIAQALIALGEAVGQVDRARQIVEQTRQARHELPNKMATAQIRTGQIPGMVVQAERLLVQLQAAFDSAHWGDLVHLPLALQDLAVGTAKAIAQGQELGRPEIQQYVAAVRSLDECLAQWESVHAQVGDLQSRPSALADRRGAVEASLVAAQSDLSIARVVAARPDLVVPASMQEGLLRVSAQAEQVSEALRPPAVLNLTQLERQANSLCESAKRQRAELEQLARQAEEALRQYDTALAQAASAQALRSYHRASAAQLDSALVALQSAMLAGQYDQVIRHAQITQQSCRTLQQSYQSHQRAMQAQALARAAAMASRGSSAAGRTSRSTPRSSSSPRSGGFKDDAGGGGKWGKR